MELYPAVDIEGGRVARAHGELAHPLAALDTFIRAGAKWIHLVDMDRAFGRGRKDNHELIGAVLSAAATRVQVQVGGGLFRETDIDQMFNLGATRVVIGPRGAVDSGLVERLVTRYGARRLAAGIDARDGRVAPRGTADILDLTAEALATRVATLGIRTIIYNEVTRDGKLTGPDTDGAKTLAALGGGLDVIVSGGVGSLDDLRAARAAGLAGICVGRALYDGKFTIAEALACLS
ncbi:MAG TPA: HisA/HisF-related TIM barrel protein [Gemmatimonadales bacterium]|nr:HisA/HisF-related TIM barrel protein [Gemmatimonadales bacterium]